MPSSIDKIVLALDVISGRSSKLNPTLQPTSKLVKEAEEALLQLENLDPDGYAIALISIILSPDNGSNIPPRLASLLTLKALVSRRWKDNGRGSNQLKKAILLSDGNKENIRNVMLSLITTGGSTCGSSPETSLTLINDQTFQNCASSVVSKIGRLDLPLRYQTLIPALVQFAVGKSNVFMNISDDKLALTMRINTSNALEYLLSELCEKKLLLVKKYIASISQAHLSDLVFRGFSYAVQCDTEQLDDDMKISLVRYATILVKCIHHLLLSSLPTLIDAPSKGGTSNDSLETPSMSIDKVFMLILDFIPALTTQIRHNQNILDSPFHESIVSLLKHICEMVLSIQKEHSVPFGRFVEPFLHLFYSELIGYTSIIHNRSDDPDILISSSVLFIANVAGCSDYEPEESTNSALETIQFESGPNQSKRSITAKGDVSLNLSSIQNAVSVVWRNFFTHERIQSIVDIAIRYLMPLSEGRLSEWVDHAESYFLEESNRIVECDQATCGQHLYLTLFESKVGKQIISKYVLSLLADIEGQLTAARLESRLQEPSTPVRYAYDKTILLWDAIYTAVGLTSGIFDKGIHFDFNTWFLQCIVPCFRIIFESEIKDVATIPILRRRLVWLIRCTYQEISDRQMLYNILVSVLTESQSAIDDKIVRLEAVEAIISLLYDPDETVNKLINSSEVLIPSLYALADKCDELDPKVKCLSCVTLLLTTALGTGQEISGQIADITVIPLQHIWETSVDDHLQLRSEVLSILSLIASFVGIEHVDKLHPIALPMINFIFDPQNKHENGFLIEDALKLWLTLLRLSRVYGADLEGLFVRAKDVIDSDLEHIKPLMYIIECYLLRSSVNLLQSYSSHLQHILRLVVGQVKPRGAFYVYLVIEALLRRYATEGGVLLLQSGVLQTMIQSCASNYAQEKDCEPDRVIMLYLNAMSRIMLSSPHILDEGLLPHRLITKHGVEVQFGYQELVLSFIRLFGVAENYEFKILFQRLWVLFLVSCIPSSPVLHPIQEAILRNFDSILSLSLQVIKERGFALNPYSLLYDDEDEEIFDVAQDVYINLVKNHMENDIVFTSDISSIFKTKIQDLKSTMDPKIYKDLFETVEPVTLQQLEQHICN